MRINQKAIKSNLIFLEKHEKELKHCSLNYATSSKLETIMLNLLMDLKPEF